MKYIVVSFGDVGKTTYYENYLATFDNFDDAKRYASGMDDVLIRNEFIVNRISGDKTDFETSLKYYKDDIPADAEYESIYDLCEFLNSLEMYGCGNEFFVDYTDVVIE